MVMAAPQHGRAYVHCAACLNWLKWYISSHVYFTTIFFKVCNVKDTAIAPSVALWAHSVASKPSVIKDSDPSGSGPFYPEPL